MRRRAGGIHEGRVALQLLEHLLVLLIGGNAGHAEGDDLDAPQVAPLLAQHLVEGVRQLHGVAGQLGVTDAGLADLGEGGLEGRQQLGLELAVQPVAGVVLADVAADVGVEQHGVGDAVAVLAEAADAHVDVDAGPLVHHAEGHGAGRAVLIADKLLGVEVVDALILGGLAAEGKAVGHGTEHVLQALAQTAAEQGRLRGHVVGILAGLGAHVHDLALVHDEHALAVRHRDDGAVGDDVVIAVTVAGASGGLFLSLYRQHVLGNGVTIKIFLPLVSQRTAGRAHRRSDKSHSLSPFSAIWGRSPVSPRWVLLAYHKACAYAIAAR